ncbi:centromere protein R-like isoform X2 [Sinocyclocheilus anshuiensis]|uniref:centromere protein R-like isoform X2 n=1 Tax=Sinocyclocheilus anshuiensis TaxID=1608454 RepID=UPI0007B9B0F5|nr:PREDICTED: centromere protein R-like isoform X2 [Sinocyclocheilus anshuiensis]
MVLDVKRALQLQDKENSPAKRQAPNRDYSPMTGTQLMSPTTKPAGNSRAGGKKTNTPQTKEPMTDAERILFLRSKVKKSFKDLMKYRQQLEALVPVEGSSELRSLLLMSPADLQTELKRHENLCAKIAPCAHRADTNKGHFQGLKQTGSSYEFLKAILSR